MGEGIGVRGGNFATTSACLPFMAQSGCVTRPSASAALWGWQEAQR
jgi:hypothetical protein